MDTVVDLTNYKSFLNNGIRVVLPKTIPEHELPYNENSEYLWFSYGLNDVDELFLSDISGDLVNSRAVFIQNHLKMDTNTLLNLKAGRNFRFFLYL
jgi:hypothetical protein